MTQEQINSLLAKPATKSCTWTEDADGNWHTGCQQIHVIISGTPDENGYVYCPYCGGGVRIRMTSLEICDQMARNDHNTANRPCSEAE